MKRSILISVLSMALCAISASSAFGQGLPGAAVHTDPNTGAPADRAAPKSRMQERCKDNPQQCEEIKARMKERRAQCKADPQRCQEMKAKMKERRAQCQTDSGKCRADRKARFEELCKQNPQRCEKIKARMQARAAQCKADPSKCRSRAGN